MQVQWYGQSAFRLTSSDTTLAIDPFAAGTERGPNTIFAFELEGLRVLPVEDLPVVVLPAAP